MARRSSQVYVSSIWYKPLHQHVDFAVLAHSQQEARQVLTSGDSYHKVPKYHKINTDQAETALAGRPRTIVWNGPNGWEDWTVELPVEGERRSRLIEPVLESFGYERVSPPAAIWFPIRVWALPDYRIVARLADSPTTKREQKPTERWVMAFSFAGSNSSVRSVEEVADAAETVRNMHDRAVTHLAELEADSE